MIREILAIALIASGLSLLGWALAAPERLLSASPFVIGELTAGIWLFLLRSGGRERK